MFAGQPHRIDVVDWIIVAVAEEIVIVRVEQLRILAQRLLFHEKVEIQVQPKLLGKSLNLLYLVGRWVIETDCAILIPVHVRSVWQLA